MAEFTPSKKTAQDFNNGIKYVDGYDNETGDSFQAEAANSLVESALYSQEQAENAVSSASSAVDTANNSLDIANDLDEQIKTANATANFANTTSQEAKDIAEEAKEIAETAQKGVGTKVSINGNVVATFDADTKVNKSGDTMTGPLYVPKVYIQSDDPYIGVQFSGESFTQGNNYITYSSNEGRVYVSSKEQTVLECGNGQKPVCRLGQSGDWTIPLEGHENNLISYNNEFNFIPQGFHNDILYINYRGGYVGTYRFMNGDGAGGLADISAASVYDHEQRVFSPNNLPTAVEDNGNGQAITFAYSKAGLQINEFDWLACWKGSEMRAVDKKRVVADGYSLDEVITYAHDIIIPTYNSKRVAFVYGKVNTSGSSATFQAVTFPFVFKYAPLVLTTYHANDNGQIENMYGWVKSNSVTQTGFSARSYGGKSIEYLAIGTLDNL